MSTVLSVWGTKTPTTVKQTFVRTHRKNRGRSNVEPRLAKLDRLLFPWKGKRLSLFGKVTVINSLIVSQFTNLFQVLPNPSKSFFDLYEKKIFYFIWNGGPERVSRKTIYNSIDNGGLNLINLYAFALTIKASWMPKLYFNPDWFTSWSLGLYLSVGFELLPFLQLDSLQYFKLNPFLSDIANAWYQYQHKTPTTPAEVRQQLLCMNSNILIGGKPFFLSSFLNRGILFINDILNSDCSLMSYNQFCMKYSNVCSPLQYLQLYTAIPSKWKASLLESPHPFTCIPDQYDSTWLKNIKINKSMYKFFLMSYKLIDVSHNVQLSWLYLFDTPIPWRQVYTSIFHCTIDPTTRFFQYRIVHKFLPTNRLLYIWKCIDSPLCSFCHAEEETYQHVFWDCPHLVSFWQNIQNWFQQKTGLKLHLNAFNVIFGNLHSDAPKIGNLVIVLAKMCIYKSRKANHVNFHSFLNYINFFHKVEYSIATRRGKLLKHRGKWGTLCS